MKKTYRNRIEVYESEDPREILSVVTEELPERFSLSMLELLRETNSFAQYYYYAKSGEHYAFFTLYKNRLNLFTYGKCKLYKRISTVGYPCSFSCPGYATDDLHFLLSVVKTLRGPVLVLNVTNPVKEKGMAFGETLPTCVLSIPFSSPKEYFSSLRSHYRRRLRLAQQHCKEAGITVQRDDAADIYRLYENTYQKSNYKLEKMQPAFFERADAEKYVYRKNGKAVGFTLLRQSGDKLDFWLCGMDYSEETADLYYFMLGNIVLRAIEGGCSQIDFGQTSEQTKMRFGAIPEKRYFYAHHSNPLVNRLVIWGQHLLEYKYDFPTINAFRTDEKDRKASDESIREKER